MTKRSSLRVLAFSFLSLLAVSPIAFGASMPAGELKFPPEGGTPFLTVETPSDWKVDWMSGISALGMTSKDDKTSVDLVTLPTDAAVTDEASAKAYLPTFIKTMGADYKAGPITETEIAGNKAYQTKVTGGLADPTLIILTPDGKNYCIARINTGDAKAILDTIKPTS